MTRHWDDDGVRDYDEGFEHGVAMRREGHAFERRTVVDDSDDPFWRGYLAGWRSADRNGRSTL